jgi:hypothetical protein
MDRKASIKRIARKKRENKLPFKVAKNGLAPLSFLVLAPEEPFRGRGALTTLALGAASREFFAGALSKFSFSTRLAASSVANLGMNAP